MRLVLPATIADAANFDFVSAEMNECLMLGGGEGRANVRIWVFGSISDVPPVWGLPCQGPGARPTVRA